MPVESKLISRIGIDESSDEKTSSIIVSAMPVFQISTDQIDQEPPERQNMLPWSIVVETMTGWKFFVNRQPSY